MMNVLVTGGAGFIGSHLCDSLIERGDDVTVMDDLSLGRMENILVNNPHFKLVKEDLLNVDAMDSVFDVERFDMVYISFSDKF